MTRSSPRVELYHELEAIVEPGASRGRVISVVGSVGAGKTTLLASVIDAAVGRSVRVVRLTGSARGTYRPFHAVQPLLGNISDAEVEQLPDPLGAALEQVDSWCAESPVILWVDNLHELDGGSVNVISRLARATVSMPLTVVLTARSEPWRTEVADLVHASPVRRIVPPLNLDEIAELTRDRLGMSLGPHLQAHLQLLADSPLAVGLSLDLLRDQGSLEITRNRVELAESADPDVTVIGVVRARLDSLPTETVTLADALAVLGSPADSDEVRHVADMSDNEFAQHVEPALTARMVEWQGSSLAFTHDVYGEQVLAGLSDDRRSALHRASLKLLEQHPGAISRIAEHASMGGRAADTSLVRSAASALGRIAPDLEAALLGRIEPLLADTDTEDVVADRAHALHLAGQPRQAEDLLRFSMPRATTVAGRERLGRLLLISLNDRASIPASMAEIASQLAAPGLSDTFRIELVRQQCWHLLMIGQLAGADARLAQLIAAMEEMGESLEPLTITRATLALAHGRPQDALAIVDAFTRSGSDGPIDQRMPDPALMTLFHLYAEGSSQAVAVSAAGRQQSLVAGAQWVLPFHDWTLGGVQLEAGWWDDAAATLDSGIELAQATGTRWVSNTHGRRALIDAHRGDLQLAAERIALVRRDGLPSQFGWDYIGLADLVVAEADPRRDHQVAAEHLWQEARRGGGELWLARIAAHVMRTGAQAVQDDVVTTMTEWTPGQMPGLDPVRRQVIGMHAGDAASVLHAAQEFTSAENPLAAALALEEGALIAARQDLSTLARTTLRTALSAFDQLGARTDEARLRARAGAAGLRSGGAATRRRPTSGWKALTPTELTVARLIRQGLTNPQIARELFVSPRTVQTHVSHILDKLGARSRVEIAASFGAA